MSNITKHEIPCRIHRFSYDGINRLAVVVDYGVYLQFYWGPNTQKIKENYQDCHIKFANQTTLEVYHTYALLSPNLLEGQTDYQKVLNDSINLMMRYKVPIKEIRQYLYKLPRNISSDSYQLFKVFINIFPKELKDVCENV